ncbi:glycosyl hydrolase family 28-related protein [Planctomycetota bacterium]
MEPRSTFLATMTVNFALFFIAMHVPTVFSDEEPQGLVGRWEFDDGTGKDLSGNGNDAVLQGTQIVSLGAGCSCAMLMPDTAPVKIPLSEDSPLAIPRGTICFWLNVGWTHSNILSFNNGAVQLNVYRGDFQVRFAGEGDFKYGSGILDYNWPNYDMREWAFYGHPRAAVHDSTWHHFAVAYDDEGKRIVGWRDGELIAVVDLSKVNIEPLKRKGLTAITTGKKFAGFIDDLRIYNRVLKDTDLHDIHSVSKSIYAGRQDTNPTDKTYQSYKYQQEDRSLYSAWLQYGPRSGRLGQDLLKHIVVEGSNSTVRTATGELTEAVRSVLSYKPTLETTPVSGPKVVLGTAKTSPWIRERAEELGLDRIKADGFIIKTLGRPRDRTLVIAGEVPAGVIFGVFDLIRRLQLGQDLQKLDVLENPQIPIRMVNHWSYFRGFLGDKWRGGGRDDSIYSWQELRSGDTKLIRDWVRLLASTGWNAICPSEVNWDYRDNFLDHLDEVETLAGILRDYGMRLYWSPSYLLALDPATAASLYARVPDFGGYMMKLGSEKQNGDPRPPMVNRIADNLAPHGGTVLVRGFVYGNYRYTAEPYRHLIPHDVFVPEDGNYRDNVVLVPKGSAGDWDLSAPIPAIDGALKKTWMGSELVIDKNFPSSWVEKWKWWLEQDTYRNGPGSLNKFSVHCIMGVAMISPSPAWTQSPLNMVNYYGLGRLAWNPDRSLDEIYNEWIVQTFGNDPDVVDTINRILFLSDDVARKLYMYRGYRGIWIDKGDENMVENKTPYAINPEGIGPASTMLQQRLLKQYAPGLRTIYGDPLRGEEFLSAFHFKDHDYRLSLGRTLIHDVYAGMEEAVQMAEQMVKLWKTIEGKIDVYRFDYTLDNLVDFVDDAQDDRDEMAEAFENRTGRKQAEALSSLTTENLAKLKVCNVRHFGAVGDGSVNDAAAVNRAIENCNAIGGGTVFVPSGLYTVGSIHMKSNVTLILDKGAVLKALPGVMDPWEANPNDQGLMDPAYYHWEASLIWGKDLENVKIYGPGTLDGSALTRSSQVPPGTGDKGIALKLCQNIEIRNLNIREGGHYAILTTGCENVLIDNVTIKTGRDGLNLSQCCNVEVANCHIDAVRYEDGYPAGGDDAIKLGSDLSLGKARPSQNITVRNCYLASGCNGLQFGTETIAPFRNIRFENIFIQRAGKAGIGITSNDGSHISDIHFQDIAMEKTFVPVFIKLSDVARVPSGTYRRGTIRDITFENISARDCYSYFKDREMPCVIWGKPESPIENIEFKNVQMTVKGGHPASEASLNPEENDERFPRKVGGLPAYAWYMRHVKDIHFLDCEFGFERKDGRPGVVVDDGENVSLERCSLQKGGDADSLIVSRNGPEVMFKPK